jgi:hypothetical protein
LGQLRCGRAAGTSTSTEQRTLGALLDRAVAAASCELEGFARRLRIAGGVAASRLSHSGAAAGCWSVSAIGFPPWLARSSRPLRSVVTCTFAVEHSVGALNMNEVIAKPLMTGHGSAEGEP